MPAGRVERRTQGCKRCSLQALLLPANDFAWPQALLCGFAFGGHWAVIPAVMSDLFGLKNYASIYTFFQLAPASGSYLIGTILVSFLYNRALASHGDERSCVGPDCVS